MQQALNYPLSQPFAIGESCLSMCQVDPSVSANRDSSEVSKAHAKCMQITHKCIQATQSWWSPEPQLTGDCGLKEASGVASEGHLPE